MTEVFEINFAHKMSKKVRRKLIKRLDSRRFYTASGIQIKVDVWRRACIFFEEGLWYYRDEAEVWHQPKLNTWQCAVTEFQGWLYHFENVAV